MKYCIIIIMVLWGMSFSRNAYADYTPESFAAGNYVFQKDPFYFLKAVPDRILVNGNIDLSFFRNQLIVFQYRYRVEIPGGIETTLDQELTTWSPWINYDFIQLLIPEIRRQGAYKFIVEYRTKANSDTKVYEKVFYAFDGFTATSQKPVATRNTPANDRISSISRQANVPDNKSSGSPAGKPGTVEKTTTVAAGGQNFENSAIETRKAEIPENVKIDVNFIAGLLPVDTGMMEKLAGLNNPGINVQSSGYGKGLTSGTTNDSVSMDDPSLNLTGGSSTSGKDESMIALFSNSVSVGDLITTIKDKNFTVNEISSDGNSLLHLAIMSGRSSFAVLLINDGANLNQMNNQLLSPLHLSVLLKNEEVADSLIKKGAEIDLKGNSGYTALHIATEMNSVNAVKNLLSFGANKRMKTGQGLTAATIAKIQKNTEILKLLKKSDQDTMILPGPGSPSAILDAGSDRRIPVIDFNLPYENDLANRRRLNNTLQIISIPAFFITTSIVTSMISKANHYYTLSRVAESESLAKQYYEKMSQYDKYSYISGGISLITVYSFIHSSIRKKNISGKMYKLLDQK